MLAHIYKHASDGVAVATSACFSYFNEKLFSTVFPVYKEPNTSYMNKFSRDIGAAKSLGCFGIPPEIIRTQ